MTQFVADIVRLDAAVAMLAVPGDIAPGPKPKTRERIQNFIWKMVATCNDMAATAEKWFGQTFEGRPDHAERLTKAVRGWKARMVPLARDVLETAKDIARQSGPLKGVKELKSGADRLARAPETATVVTKYGSWNVDIARRKTAWDMVMPFAATVGGIAGLVAALTETAAVVPVIWVTMFITAIAGRVLCRT